MKLITLAMISTLVALHIASAEELAGRFVIQSGDISAITLIITETPRVRLTLSDAKVEDLRKLTGGNIGKQIQLIIGDQVVSKPVVGAEIRGPEIEISAETREMALEWVKVLYLPTE